MLYLYYGNDTIGVRAAAHEAAAGGATLVRIDADTYEEGILANALWATSLFGDERAYLLDTPSSDEEFSAAVAALLPELTAAKTQFFVIEGPLLAEAKKHYAKYAAVMEEVKQVAAKQANPFALADALARRDKKSLWILLTEAVRGGARPEETVGMLWWQLKLLLLAKTTASAAEAGVSDYPYKKAKQALGKYKPGEIEALARSLLTLYHDAHAGKRQMDLALEEWVLTI